MPAGQTISGATWDQLARLKRVVEDNKLELFKPLGGGQEEFLKSTARNRLMSGGNRAGKTTVLGVDMIWHADGRHPYQQVPPPPIFMWLVVKKLPKETDAEAAKYRRYEELAALQALREWMPRRLLINGEWADSWSGKSYRLTLTNGSVIELKSWNQPIDEFESDPVSYVGFDEPPPLPIWQATRMRILDTEGRRSVSGTVLSEAQHWVIPEIVERHEKGDSDYWAAQISLLDNPHISESEREKILLEIHDPKEREARVYGGYVRRAGPVFDEYSSDVHLSKLPCVPMPGVPMLCAWDTGVTHKYPSAVIAQDHERQLTLFDHFQLETGFEPFLDLVLETRRRKYPRVQWIDYSDPAAWQHERMGHRQLTCVDYFVKAGVSPIAGEVSLVARLNGMRYRMGRNVRGRPCFLVNCQQESVNSQTGKLENMLHVGLEHGYHYPWSRTKRTHASKPLQNVYAHIVEAASYLPFTVRGMDEDDSGEDDWSDVRPLYSG